MDRLNCHDQSVSYNERSLLAGILTGRVRFEDVDGVCQPDDFIDDDNASLFACLRDIAMSGLPLALSAIQAELHSRGLLVGFGGADGLRLLHSEGRVSWQAAAYHAQQVAQAGRRRRLRAMLLEAAADCDSDRPADEIVRGIESQVRDLEPVRSDDYYSAGQAASAALQEIESARASGTQLGLMSGLRDLDAHIGGFRPGQMVVLAARPSIGKSCVGAEIAQRVAEAGRRVLFANLEMSKSEMGTRFLSRLSGIPSNLLRSPCTLDDSDLARLRRANERMADSHLILWGGAGRSIGQLSSAARRFHGRAPISLLVVDYLGLIAGGDGKSRYEQVSTVSQKVKSLAMELELPVLAMCQLNRDSEKNNREPCLADLRDSGAIEQDADICIFIVRQRDSEKCVLKIAKFRNGQLGSVPVRFEGQFSRVTDVAKEQTWRG
ncbi:MAG: AAA family ATPase [Pirellulaceae bacterium]|nr:AAA family ATPase [Pirellulaceae bacterium]